MKAAEDPEPVQADAWARARAALRRLTVRQWVWGGLALLLLLALVIPWMLYFLVAEEIPLALMALATAAAWLLRRSAVDALLLCAALLAVNAFEHGTAPALAACLALPLAALSRRPRFAILVSATVVLMAIGALELAWRFAGKALGWPDVQLFFLDFAGHAGVFATQPTIVASACAALFVLVAVAIGGWRWDAAAAPRRAGMAQWTGPMLALLVAGWSAHGLAQEAQEGADDQQHWLLLTEEAGFRVPLERFLATTQRTAQWKPPHVETQWFRQLAQRHRQDGLAGTRADIVVFLQESQMNPRAISGCPDALCRLPVFDAQEQTRAFGPLQVHVFGNGTWLSEFALATGVPHWAFGPTAGLVPFSVAGGVRRSFARSLRAAGYRTVAVYPTTGRFMNARNAYRGYGFDAFYDARDLHLTGSFRTPDRLVHEAALRVLEQERRHGQPVFLFVQTIFNHGEHGVFLDAVPPELLRQAEAAFPDRKEAENVADYVWRTREFEQAMDRTRHQLLHSARPAVLAWFGDHQPAFGSALGLRSRVQSAPEARGRIPTRLQTWYRVDSNVAARPVGQPQPLDIVFFPSLLAEAAGVPLDEWLAANLEARLECDRLLQACAHPLAHDAYLAHLHDDLKVFSYP